MQSDVTGDLFYTEAFEFFQSAKIVKESQDRVYFEQMLAGPISYQIRHSMELILKAYIIRFENENGNESWNEKKYGGEGRKLLSIHSLNYLLCIADDVFPDRLGIISNEDRRLICSMDEFDKDSTFFRYPCDKLLNPYFKDFERASDRKAFRSAPCCIGNFLYHNDFEYYADPHFNDAIIDIEDSMFTALSSLLDEYEKRYLQGQK